MSEYKTCTKCLQTKSLDDFHKVNKKPRSRCKPCHRLLYHENLEKSRAYSRKSYQKNKAQKSEYQKKYKASNPEKVKATKQKYVKTNPEKRAASLKKYNQANAEKILANKRAFYTKHAHRWLDYAAKRRQQMQSSFRITDKELQKLLRQSCLYCGSKERIELDHIVPLSRGGRHSIGNLAPACFSCNRSKAAKFVTEWRYKFVINNSC